MTPTKIPLPAILAVQMGVAIVTLDISLTSTALPAIAIGIDASPASTIWIINVYYLAVVAASCRSRRSARFTVIAVSFSAGSSRSP